MSTIKVLKLQMWMCQKELEDARFFTYPQCQPINPRIGKPGWYMYQNTCWFENDAGKAFKISSTMFKFEMSLLEAERYNNQKIYNALVLLRREGLITKQQTHLLNNLDHLRSLRASKIDFAKMW